MGGRWGHGGAKWGWPFAVGSWLPGWANGSQSEMNYVQFSESISFSFFLSFFMSGSKAVYFYYISIKVSLLFYFGTQHRNGSWLVVSAKSHQKVTEKVWHLNSGQWKNRFLPAQHAAELSVDLGAFQRPGAAPTLNSWKPSQPPTNSVHTAINTKGQPLLWVI